MALSDKLKKEAKREVLSKKITKLVIAFIQMPDDKTLAFNNYGSLIDATKLVQCMRVKLSRMRAELKSQGKRSKTFKMNLHSYEYNESTNETKVILTKLSPIIPDDEMIDLLNILEDDKSC